MSTDAGSAAAPEDAATRDEEETRSEREPAEAPDTDAPDTDATDTDGADDVDGEGTASSSDAGYDPSSEGFVASMLRDATITGLPGDTGAPPVEPEAPQAQQEGDEPD